MFIFLPAAKGFKLMSFFKMGQSRTLLVYFCSFHIQIPNIFYYINWSIDVLLGIRTRSRMMVGTDDSTELWRPPKLTAIIGGVDATFIPLPWTENSIVVPIWELEPTTVNSIFFLLFSLTLFHSERHYHRHKVLIRRSDLEHFNLSLSLSLSHTHTLHLS